MASAANARSEQENRDPERPRITRRNRGHCARNAPLDLEYLQRPSYCDAGFALEQISEVLIVQILKKNNKTNPGGGFNLLHSLRSLERIGQTLSTRC